MSGARDSEPRELGWTSAQRRALIFLLTILLAWLAFQAARDRAYVPDPQPGEGSRSSELASRLDPNKADWQELAAIPTLGPKRAKAIVEFRDHLRASDANAVVFRSESDLLRIRGIGPATVENLRPFLVFPGHSATTRR
jgi:DNA uptake protein ComE-like DNA-binding protein